MITHYVPLPTLQEAARNRHKVVVAVCGAIDPVLVTARTRAVNCEPCRKAMINEERER